MAATILDLTEKHQAIVYMRLSTDWGDWDRHCDAVRAANGGDYPEFWPDVIRATHKMRVAFGPYSMEVYHVEVAEEDEPEA